MEHIPESILFDGIRNKRELQTIQDKICSHCHVFACCVSPNYEPITGVSGDYNEIQMLEEHMPEGQWEELARRVAGNSLEEQAVEGMTSPDLRFAAVSIRAGRQHVMTWLVCGVIVEPENDIPVDEVTAGFRTTVTEKEFYDCLDFIRTISSALAHAQVACAGAEAESQRSRSSELEMSQSLRRIEATTEVVQLLDREGSIEEILYDVMKVVGRYLKVSSAQVYQVYDNEEMDVVVEWRNEGIVSFFEKTKKIPVFHFLNIEKPLILSTNSLRNYPYHEELRALDIRAIAAFPLMIQNKTSMYVCFNQSDRGRSWTAEEVKFISDAVKVLLSILARRIQKNSLAGSYASLEMTLDNIGCCIYIRDIEDGKALFVNRNFKKNFEREILDGTINDLLDSSIVVDRNTGIYEFDYLVQNKWFDMKRTEISWVDGKRVRLYSLYEITDKKVYQKKIEQQAYTDFLTGLYNRMCCERDLAWHIDEAKKRQETGTVLYLDLDDFKHINDGLGHQYGDVLLKDISSSLQQIEEISNTCYRMGGDEFVIIIPSEYYDRVDEIIKEIRKIFEKPWFLKDADYYCTMSMGIVEFPNEGESVQDFIKKADIAMYEAKKSGKNQVARYTESLETVSGWRLDMEKNMRNATVGGYKEFEIYYQPIIDIQLDGTPCTGAEALIRWNSAELGFISPAEFIPLAEYLGLINPIGNHVLREACYTCKRWNDNGHPNYKVNVNLSVVQLLQPDIVDIVAKTVEETGIRPSNLTLEVTESLAINDMERMKDILSNIKKLGVRIALDDFGTGYSSLSYIREIPFDVIKVEQSFVKDLADDAYSQSFIKMVSELATTIGVSICVEGIENKDQYKVLEGMKVRLVQGYYFDRPMPRSQFEQKYVNKKQEESL